jgi:hypothetical protein
MCAFACVSFQHNNRPFHLLSCANDRNIEEKERWLLRFASPQKPAQIFKCRTPKLKHQMQPLVKINFQEPTVILREKSVLSGLTVNAVCHNFNF